MSDSNRAKTSLPLDNKASHRFCQDDLLDKYPKYQAAKSGVCKALVMQWIAKSWKQVDFFGWIGNSDETERKKAEAGIMVMSLGEVMDTKWIPVYGSLNAQSKQKVDAWEETFLK